MINVWLAVVIAIPFMLGMFFLGRQHGTRVDYMRGYNDGWADAHEEQAQ